MTHYFLTYTAFSVILLV